jgi:DNA-binding beta-propeller fold protein YncE
MMHTMRGRAAAIPLAFAVALGIGGCAIDAPAPVAPDGGDPPPDDPVPARVLVLNGGSETISSFDLSTGSLTPFAAPAGSWPNRFVSLPDRGEIAVVASGDNEIQFHDAHTLALVGAADVGAGSNPWAGARWGDRLIASNWLSGGIVEVDVASRAPLRRLSTSASGPEGILVEGDLAYVACTHDHGPTDSYLDGWVDVVDLASWTVLASIPVAVNPQEIHRAPDGRLHVVCTGTNGTADTDPNDGAISVVNPSTRTVESVVSIGGSPGRLAFGAGGIGWVAGYWGGVRRYDALTLAILPPPPDPELAASGFSAVAWDSTSGTMYVASHEHDLLIAIDETTDSIREAWIVGDGPVDVLVQRP